MSTESPTGPEVLKPRYHTSTDVFLWHQYQGESTNDCAPFSVAIVANAILNRPRFDGYAVAREMEKLAFVNRPLPHIALRKVPNWFTLPWGISGYLQSKGIPARLRWFGDVEGLLRNARENRLTIVIIGDLLRLRGSYAHAKVLYGFEPPGSPMVKAGLYFVDPGIEKDKSGLPRLPEGVFWQDEAEFKREWGNMLRVYVEAGFNVGA